MAQLNPEELTLLRGVFLFQGAEALADAAAADPAAKSPWPGGGRSSTPPTSSSTAWGSFSPAGSR